MRPASTEEDGRLVERARAGDRVAFEELVLRHAERLHAVVIRFVANAEEAQEVTQEAFLRAWRSIDRFEGRSGFFTWLYRIGMNEAKRRAERNARQGAHAVDEESVPEPADWSLSPETRSEQADLRRLLEEAIRDLPVDYRMPVILRDVEGMSTRDAARIMELGEAAFKSRLHRGRLAVRARLDEHLSEDDR